MNEANYKEWFDENYPQYSSIYEAVGLESPEKEGSTSEPPPPAVAAEDQKDVAPFVDPTRDPQYYIDRYLNEANYKEWFDENFPEFESIYEAVGISKPAVGICGPGTELIEGVCRATAAEGASATPSSTDNESQQKNGGGGGGCLIATAAYGSELAPQVQLLREARDGKVMNTITGASFVSAFNQFYYSFSPTVADWERQNPIFKDAVKLALTPMLSTLSILNFVDIDSEQDIIGYGIGIILMNIGMYFVAPAIIISKAIGRIKKEKKTSQGLQDA